MTEALHEPLEAPAVKETVEELYGRIEARFPTRGLLGVCRDLAMLVDEVQTSAGQGQRRIRMARIVSRVVMAFVIVVTIFASICVTSAPLMVMSPTGLSSTNVPPGSIEYFRSVDIDFRTGCAYAAPATETTITAMRARVFMVSA